jgi:hypothetical protein
LKTKINKKGDISINSLISIIISVVVMLLLFKCGSNLITQSDKYADSQMKKFDAKIEEMIGETSADSVTIKFGDDAFFAYFEPGEPKVSDKYATLIKPINCNNESQGCFCYCDEFDYESVDRSKMMFWCTSPHEMVCESYDTKFKIPPYQDFFDNKEDDAFLGGFFLFNTEATFMQKSTKDTLIGWGAVLRPFNVDFKERFRFEQNTITKEIKICMREDGECSDRKSDSLELPSQGNYDLCHTAGGGRCAEDCNNIPGGGRYILREGRFSDCTDKESQCCVKLR